MTAYTQIEKFITEMAKWDQSIRLTVEFDPEFKVYTARMVDGSRTDIAMLDVNKQHYLVAKDESIELALAELSHMIELQYC